MSVYNLLAATAARFPDRAALSVDTRTWTFREFCEVSDRLAGRLLKRGVGAGDLVGLLMRNRPEWLFWFLAVSRIGGVAVLINPAYTANEVRSVLTFAGLRMLILDERLAEVLDAGVCREVGSDVVIVSDHDEAEEGLPEESALPAPGGSDSRSLPAVIYLSSGSTGSPKGIVHSAANLELIADVVRRNWRVGPGDSLLVSMPLAFVYASVVECLTAISAGAMIMLQERFRAEEAVELIASGEVTVIMGVPSMYRMLVPAGKDLRSRGRLRLCATGGDILSPALDREFEEIFGCPLFDLYGLTEVPHIVAHTPGPDQRSRALSCGRALPGVMARVVDDEGREVHPGEIGELIVRAPWMFLEYFRNPDATGSAVRDGWFWTGDLVRQDGDGYLYMVERKKEMIKRSGFNVLPGEVEEVIREVPGVSEVAVVGERDELRGQRVKAFVVRQVGREASAEEILAVCRRRLATYKIPEAIEFIAELPKGPTGKIMKKLLRG